MINKIEGEVIQTPTALDNCCLFAVRTKQGVYMVVSTQMQACKDNIFVEQGQDIAIEGSAVTDIDLKGVIVTEKAKIINLEKYIDRIDKSQI
jgi:hypothetical protein